MELVSIQNRYGHGISFSQHAIVRVRESIRWALIASYVDLQLNCGSLGAMRAIYQHSSLSCPTSRRPIRRPIYDYLKFGGFQVKIGDPNPF